MAVQYLTGKDGIVTITPSGGSLTTIYVTKWTYRGTAEMAKTRSGGDGAYARDKIAVDWEANIEGLVKKGVAAPNLQTPLGANTTAFALKTDAAPKFLVAGAGAITEFEYGSPVDDHVTVSFKLECDDADAANLPTITPIA